MYYTLIFVSLFMIFKFVWKLWLNLLKDVEVSVDGDSNFKKFDIENETKSMNFQADPFEVIRTPRGGEEPRTMTSTFIGKAVD